MSESDRLEEVFSGALQLRDPEGRREYVRRACGEDTELEQQVFSLLSAAQEAANFLESPVRLGDKAEESGAPTAYYGPTSSGSDFPYLAAPLAADDLGSLGPYRILNCVGRGGMGIVFRAFDPKLQRVVAIKVLAPEIAIDPTARRRFEREARSAAAVSHPHCVVIHAVEEAHNPPYIVMEFVDGRTLADKISTQGALSLREILRIGSQIADGLAAAHEQGLVHRDMKPANVLLEDGVDRAKVADFGLAKTLHDASVTRSGEFSGTPQFMSPEQASGGRVDHRTDLFSLGAILYTMCTGRPPFRGDNPLAILKKICEDNPRPIGRINPEMPGWLSAIVDRLLARSPADRFQTAAEVAALLRRHLAIVQAGTDVIRPAPETKTRYTLILQWRSPWPILAFGLLAGIGFLVWLAAEPSRRNPSPLGGRTGHSPRSTPPDTRPEAGERWPDSLPSAGGAKSNEAAPAPAAENEPPDTFGGTDAGERRELTDLNIAFRWCPPGRFLMGSPKSEEGRGLGEYQAEVTLTRGFWLQETEVTQGEWQSLMGTSPWKRRSDVEEGADYAATFVRHSGNDGAVEFCRKLTARERAAGRLPSRWEYRLPTEAEWEYACRAGTVTAWSFGDDPSQLSDHAWWGGNDVAGSAMTERYAHPVGLKKANGWGLKDMHGNVFEWCEDVISDTLPGGRDPRVTTGHAGRLFRGGAWPVSPEQCRSASRPWGPTGFRDNSVGFRPLASPSR